MKRIVYIIDTWKEIKIKSYVQNWFFSYTFCTFDTSILTYTYMYICKFRLVLSDILHPQLIAISVTFPVNSRLHTFSYSSAVDVTPRAVIERRFRNSTFPKAKQHTSYLFLFSLSPNRYRLRFTATQVIGSRYLCMKHHVCVPWRLRGRMAATWGRVYPRRQSRKLQTPIDVAKLHEGEKKEKGRSIKRSYSVL